MKTKTPKQLVPGDVLVAKIKFNDLMPYDKCIFTHRNREEIHYTLPNGSSDWSHIEIIEELFHLPALPQSAPKLNNVVICNDNEQTAELIKAFWEGQGYDCSNINFQGWGTYYGVIDGNFTCCLIPNGLATLCLDNLQVTPEVTQPKYRPYTFEDRDEFRDLWYVEKGEEKRIDMINYDGVNFITYQHLFDNCTKLDGTPFGKLITE